MDDSLADLLDRSSQALADALDALIAAHVDLRVLVVATHARQWTDDEFARYVTLSREERKARRHYLAARDWYDGVRRRVGRDAPRQGRET